MGDVMSRVAEQLKNSDMMPPNVLHPSPLPSISLIGSRIRRSSHIKLYILRSQYMLFVMGAHNSSHAAT